MRPAIAGFAVVKNEEESLGRMLSSVMPHVDAFYIVDTGSTDKTVEIAKNFGCQVTEAGRRFVHPLYEGGVPVFNFDEAKNFALDQVPKDKYPYVIWLDADDELLQGHNIPKCLQLMEEQNITALYCRYLYYVDFDDQGRIKNINIEHLRERIVRNDGSHKWVGKLHETMIEQRPTVKTDNYDIMVLQHTDWARMERALWRNIELIQEIVVSENGRDPRNVYYLAKTIFDLHDPMFFDYIIGLLKIYLETSGWEEERAQAWVFLSSTHLEKGETEHAIRASLMSLHENPRFPDSYINLAICYVMKRDWERALHWCRLASQVDIPKTTLVVTPKDLQVKILEVIWHSCMNLGKLDEAEGAINKLLTIDGKNEEFLRRKQGIEDLKRDNALAHSIAKLAFFHRERKNTAKMLATLAAMPDHIAGEPAMVGLRNDLMPPRVWEDRDIAIYCGPGFERWSPVSLEQGLGGSETAVVYLSRELTRLGWKVTVFGDPGETEVRDGEVVYKPYFYFNSKDKFNIFVVWRQVGVYDLDIAASQKLLWLHDVQNPADYTETRLKRMDKVVFLSHAQRETAPTVPEEKAYYSTNGIDTGKIEKIRKKIDRNPLWVFWGSSYDRGLEHLLEMWPRVYELVYEKCKKYPQLHVFYGWQLFDVVNANNPERSAWKEKINKMLDQPGIVHHGRVGQAELLEWVAKCSVWGYSTPFYEINCITALQCQALGCIPVTMNYAALKETVAFGDKLDGEIYDKGTKEKYQKELVHRLVWCFFKPEEADLLRREMAEWARKKYGWEKVAKDWDANLLRKDGELAWAKKELLKYQPQLQQFL